MTQERRVLRCLSCPRPRGPVKLQVDRTQSLVERSKRKPKLFDVRAMTDVNNELGMNEFDSRLRSDVTLVCLIEPSPVTPMKPRAMTMLHSGCTPITISVRARECLSALAVAQLATSVISFIIPYGSTADIFPFLKAAGSNNHCMKSRSGAH